jgi:hypothetical protein
MGLQTTAADAISYYNATRVTHNKGLTVPTQITSVGYYEKCLSLQKQARPLPVRIELRLLEVSLTDVSAAGGSEPFKLKPGFFTCYSGAGATKKKECVSAVGAKHFPCNVLISDVVSIEFKLLKKKILNCGGGKKDKKSGKKLFIYNFNTAFVEDSLVRQADGTYLVVIPKGRLDKLVKDKKHKKVPAGFQLQMRFQRVRASEPPPPSEEQLRRQQQQQVSKYTMVPSMKKGEVEV